jgi:hypothetical protein
LRIQRNESLQSARIAGTEICYVPAPHLREGEDWHYAYISKIETMLTELEHDPERLPGEDWQLFAHVWNSHNQLEWLKAFLLRETAIRDWDIGISYDSGPQGIRRFSATSNHTEELDWLADFVERNESEQDAYPNPYFGGYNSLHLGFIIDEPF